MPSELSGDSEFLRRVCLDLAGMLPPPERVREFLASRDPQKREKLIDTLIGSPEFVDYWTFRFDDIFRVAVFSNGIQPKWSQMYAEWVRDNIATNKPYDQVARERIAARGLRRSDAALPSLRRDRAAGRNHGGRGPRLHGPPPGLRAVPQPSLRETGARISSGAWRHFSGACSRWGHRRTNT